MRELRENILEFLSTTFEVIVLLVWHFLIEVFFGGKEGVGIRAKLSSLGLSQVDGDDIVVINGHEGCQIRLWVELSEEGGTVVSHGVLVGGDIQAEGGQEERQELVNSCVSLMCLIPRWARGTRGAEIVVADVEIWCGCAAGTVHDLVEMANSLNGGGSPNAVDKQDGSLCLREGWRAIVGLASDVCRVAWADDSGSSSDDDGVIRESGGEGGGGGRSLIGVCIGAALFPCILLGLASGGALAMVHLLLLLLAFLLLLLQPIFPLLLLWWLLLLLLDLGVPRIVLDGANLVCVVMQLLLPGLVLLPDNMRHSLNIGEGWKRVCLLLLLFALYKGGDGLGGHTHIEYLDENVHVLQ